MRVANQPPSAPPRAPEPKGPTPPAESPAAPETYTPGNEQPAAARPSWIGQKLRDLGLNALDVAEYGALFAAQAAAGACLGGRGVALSAAGAAVGYAAWACANHDQDDAVKAAMAGSVVGALGAVMGIVAGPAGIATWGALGASGALVSKFVNWSDGWNRNGDYVGPWHL